MSLTQRFALKETVPGLPGSWVCVGASCGAEMVQREDDLGVTMEHTENCEEVARLAAERA
jgi:hypothetical protein